MRGGRAIVVAGAGAVGSAVAYALARGGWDVVVVDPSSTGGTASRVAAGMLAPAFEALFDETSAEQFGLLTAARDRWPALARALGLPLSRDGAMAVGTPAEVEAWSARLGALGARRQRLGPGEAAQLAPGVRSGAVFSPEDWRLEPAAALTALRSGAEALGARFVVDRVAGFADGRVELAGGEALVAGTLVLATAAAQSLAELAPELAQLTPVKGHILRAAAPWPSGPVLRGRDAYLCRTPGGLVLGATMEPGLGDEAVDPSVVAGLIARGERLATGLAELTWKASTGIRAATPDGLPMVGASVTPGVIMAVGARRNGWLLAPMIAETVVEVAQGAAPPALFDPGRFRA